MDANLIVREADARDAAQIAAIEGECIPDPWSKEAIKHDMNENAHSHYIVAEVNGEVAGFIGMWIIDYEAEINNVAVLPDYRGFGVGSLMLKTVLDAADKNGVKMISLEVRSGNYNAMAMYEKAGFVKVNVRREYYRDNGEDAIIMRRIGDPSRDLKPGMES
jgi:ribosomal-protein-alanine N-acetyltransferase